MALKNKLQWRDSELECEWRREGAEVRLTYGGQEVQALLLEESAHFLEFQIDGKVEKVACYSDARGVFVHTPSGNFFFKPPKKARRRTKAGTGGEELTAPMPGKLLKVLVASGDEVKQGDTLMILEAMKMEHPIRAPHGGKVKSVYYQEGQRVSQGEELLELQ